MRSRVLALLGSFAMAGVLSAATTGQTSLHMPQGSAAGTANGDYVSDATTLNTFYRYFIEVPPGLARLTVEIFDADVGRGGAAEDDAGRDRDRGGGFSTTATYTLIRPDGTTAATLANCDAATCTDNAWTVLLNSNTAVNLAVGHWELRVDTNGGNDINAIGIRANDGTPGAGGTELNVYADSMVSLGVNPNPNAATRTFALYPYVTSGCQCTQNDFDRDANNGDTGSVTYTPADGGTPQTFAATTLSGDNAWNRDNLNTWVTDDNDNHYGVWTVSSTINTYNNGATNGNYETYYVGNYLAPANPPTANPIVSGGNPAAFRLYLQTDAGGAPVKPYLEQQLAQNRNFNGPNPAQVGVQTTYTVTVRLTNPTPYSITFSAANLVTANVPGGQVLYGGNGAVSQGSITAQPAVGGSGNITWNPGTVTAGSIEILSYDIRVIPTSGARVAVTGTPASGNGTRARFVDETGNATQARATYTLGGLCDMGVTAGLATPVILSSLDLDVRGGATQIDFATSSEAATVGFNVYRADGTKVNENLIPASLKPQGGKYHVVDRDNSDPNARYTIEEVTATGRTSRFGPFNHFKGFDREEAQRRSARFHATSQDFGVASDATFESSGEANQKVAAAMIGVSANGIVKVSATTLANILGANVNAVRASLGNGKLSVTSSGAQIAWTTDGENLLFYGQKATSIYSNERVYRVEQTSGTQMQTLTVNPAGAAVSTYSASKVYGADVFPATVLPLDSESDYWFWDYIISGDPDAGRRTFTIDVPSMASASGAQFAVKLQGAFQDGAHKALVSLNGVPVGEANFTSLSSSTTVINLPAAVLRDGANDVTIEGVLAPGAGMDIFYIDGFGLKYQRFARPENGALEARAGGAFAAGPFTAAPMILDISNALRPVVVKGARFYGGLAQAQLPSTKTLFLAESFVAPSSTRPAYEPKLALKNLRADWVAIAPHNMVSATAPLATLRQREGLTTFIADLDDVYNEFAGGNSTPYAIRDFIKSTKTWSRAPKYIVLVGVGNVDYRGLDVPPGPMPPLMTTTQEGIFASDSRFADFNNDRLPDVAIGRIPVANATELAAYIAKLDANGRRSVTSAPIVFTADNADGVTSFKRASDNASTPLAERPAEKIYLDDLGSEQARTSLFGAWQNGTPLVSWIGHGGVDQLSASAVLTAYDSADLVSSGRLPIVVAMTCTANRFENGYVDALGTTLTREAGAGALAVWSASGLSQHSLAADIQRTFMQLAQQAPAGTRLGDLILKSLANHPSDTTSIYLLLGDPAIRVDLPSEVTHGGPASAPGE